MARSDVVAVLTRTAWLLLVLGSGICRTDWFVLPEKQQQVAGLTTGAPWYQPQQNQESAVTRSSSSRNHSYDPSCPCCTDQCQFNQNNLICREVETLEDYPEDCASTVESLEIVKGRFRSIGTTGLARQNFFRILKRLIITDSQLEHLTILPNPEHLIKLDLSHNKLNYVNWKLFDQTVNLKHLNLSYNELAKIEPIKTPHLDSLNLSGNEWECWVNFKWALTLHESGVLVNGENLTCQDETKKHDSWFKWNYSIIKREINKREVDTQCQERTPDCGCDFVSLGSEGRGPYTVKVNCSYRELTQLPTTIPSFTDELNVAGNMLTSLDQIVNYGSSLKVLIADHNQIKSIRNLSDSAFLRNFSRFSLLHNLVSPKEIPLAEIVQVPSEFQTKAIYLYNNSWECDCKMATDVRDWLWKYSHIVNDSSRILCSQHGKKVSVLHLLPVAFCPGWDEKETQARAKQLNIDLLHSLIALEVLLILTVSFIFAYDSWRYYRHGELPWIANKIF